MRIRRLYNKKSKKATKQKLACTCHWRTWVVGAVVPSHPDVVAAASLRRFDRHDLGDEGLLVVCVAAWAKGVSGCRPGAGYINAAMFVRQTHAPPAAATIPLPLGRRQRAHPSARTKHELPSAAASTLTCQAGKGDVGLPTTSAAPTPGGSGGEGSGSKRGPPVGPHSIDTGSCLCFAAQQRLRLAAGPARRAQTCSPPSLSPASSM